MAGRFSRGRTLAYHLVCADLWIGVIITMLKSIGLIKAIHTAIFFVMNGAMAALLYAVILDKITLLTWVAVALFLLEGIVLIANGWQCPLTSYVERLGSTHGQITDIFLPKWLADRIFPIYTSLLVVALLLLVIRLLN
jgi:hypothetical protein